MALDGRDLWKRFIESGISGQSAADAVVPESGLQADAEKLLSLFGWKFYHTRDSRGSEGGFPDLIALRTRRAESYTRLTRLIAAELKAEGEELKPAQQIWLDLFKAFGAETYVWHPSDIMEMTKVLRR